MTRLPRRIVDVGGVVKLVNSGGEITLESLLRIMMDSVGIYKR